MWQIPFSSNELHTKPTEVPSKRCSVSRMKSQSVSQAREAVIHWIPPSEHSLQILGCNNEVSQFPVIAGEWGGDTIPFSCVRG